MDWKDIESAADPTNAAYTANELLGHALIMLERETPSHPFFSPEKADDYSRQASTALQVLDAIWLKHLRHKRDDDMDVVKSMERALDLVERWFRLGYDGGVDAVLGEQAFNKAAELILHADGHWLPGSYTGGIWKPPTQEQLDNAWKTVRRDAKRFAEFDAVAPTAWLSQARTAWVRRQWWTGPAERLQGLRKAVENAIPSGKPALVQE
jgi:hypothetical protein